MHRIVGLDVSAGAVRLVALESGFRGFSVLQAQAAPLLGGATLSERLKATLDSLGLRLGNDAVAVALPGAQVSSHLFSLPFIDPRRIEQVLPAEVEGAIPFEMDEVVWDHAVLSQEGGKSEVLVGVVRKSALKEWIATLAAAGIDARTVTFAPLALAASGERGILAARIQNGALGAELAAGAVAPEADLLIDAGPDRADIVVVRGGKPELCRALSSASPPAWEAAQSNPAAFERLLGPLVRDLKITLRTRSKGLQPAPLPGRILLAGEIARLPGAAERLAAEFGIPATPLELDSAAAQLPAGSADASEVALALGLALRAQQSRGRLNFRKGEFAFTRDFSQVRSQVQRVAVAAAVLLVLAVVLGIARVSSLGTQLKDYDDAVCAATKKILGTCTTDYRQALSQLSGGRSKAAGIPRVSAAEVLAEVVAHLPEGAMPLIEDSEVTTTSVRIRGTAEGYTQVEQITSALKADKCFGDIKPPRVEKVRDNPNKVTFAYDFAYTCSGESAGGA